VNYLREFREHLALADGTVAVRDLDEEAMPSRLRRIAARPGRSAAVA
jgi:hypothetical protein